MTNELEQEIIKLENKLNNLKTYNNGLENKLNKLNSYITTLETNYSAEVEFLEIELEKSDNKMIIELEKQPKMNQFYWFTAKKIPFFSTDVSYMSKDNHFYGFKETPNYHYIEYHDLRFITHATLDELIEQFR